MAKRSVQRIICEQCGEEAMKRPGARFCSKRCSVTWQHANGLGRQLKGEDHYRWSAKLDNYKSMHDRVNRERGKAVGCVNREDRGCTSQTFEWSHIHGTDPWEASNYVQMCKSCHITYDHQRGSGHSNAKLTVEQVVEIRARYVAGGVSQQALADEFGVNQTAIGRIVRGASYAQTS